MRGKNITEQSKVDAMAKAIEDALAALQYKDVVTTPSSTPASTKTPPPNRTSVPTKTPAPNKTAAPTATPAAESTATRYHILKDIGVIQSILPMKR